MIEEVIKLDNLTKDYGENCGIFHLDLTIYKGEMIGFVGTNGSGKTTTIRNIMGFLHPTEGHAYVNGLESWDNASEIARHIGYVPGEIAFPDLKTGTEFLKSQAGFLGIHDMSYANTLIEKLQLDPSANLKRMSKGMKQKTAIVAALMNDSDILILDEPTTGLDPLMRVAFLDVIEAEHKRGKTILMSSHMFEELEKLSDRVALISDGHIIDIADMNEDIHNRPQRDFKIEFHTILDYEEFKKSGYEIMRDHKKYSQVTVRIDKKNINSLFQQLKKYDVKFISEVKYTLDKHFKEIMNEGE
jgi:ABC-2 type transport system ATP-binding protein